MIRTWMLLLGVLFTYPAAAKPPVTRKAVLSVQLSRKMLSEKDTQTVVDQMIAAIVNIDPTLDPEAKVQVSYLVRELFPSKLFLKVRAALYLRHFNEKELEELNRFYDTPTGRKLAELTPLMAQESAAIFTKISEQAMAELIKALPKKKRKSANRKARYESFANN